MATKKQSRKTADRKISTPKSARKSDFFSQINWGESYTSLILGAIVVVVGLILVFSFLKSRNLMTKQATSTSTSISTPTANNQISTTPRQTAKMYVVKSGDDLWSISEKIYGSGYNWVDIARVNNLQNPGVLFSGTKLVIPDVKPIVINKNAQPNAPSAITGNTYTIEKGDNLWQIAVRAYGDGYKWTEIAKANKLINPNLIHSGNKLIISR